MNLRQFFSGIPGNELERNIYSPELVELTEEHIEKYPFLKKDQEYIEFLKNINGIEIYKHPFILIIYGFSLRENELHFSPSHYQKNTGYLAFSEFVEKRENEKWKGIAYFYNEHDEQAIIYAGISAIYNKPSSGTYYPLCVGFANFLKIITTKNYQEQLQIAV